MNRDRLLADAKAKALSMLADGYQPPKPAGAAPARPDRQDRRLNLAVRRLRAAGQGAAA